MAAAAMMFNARPLATNERFFNSSPNSQMGNPRGRSPSTTLNDPYGLSAVRLQKKACAQQGNHLSTRQTGLTSSIRAFRHRLAALSVMHCAVRILSHRACGVPGAQPRILPACAPLSNAK
jgi:hypothetical protein